MIKQKNLFFSVMEILKSYPIDCVYAVIEVKSNLNHAELNKAFKNMESVRNLEKKAYFKPIFYDMELYGKKWEIWPINYYIFAYDSIELKKNAELMSKKYEEDDLPAYSRIDTICVLDKSVICNYLEGKLNALSKKDLIYLFQNHTNPFYCFILCLAIILIKLGFQISIFRLFRGLKFQNNSLW